MSEDEARVVVGVAVIRNLADGPRVLVAQRSAPAHVAGWWELPGGKVEPGESLAQAAEREIAEELGCRIRVRDVLPHREPVRPGLVLQVVRADLVSGDPHPHEHQAVAWVGVDDLEALRWTPADIPFVALLARELRGREQQVGEVPA